jgi:hypothetical protein
VAHTPGPWLNWNTLEWLVDPQELLTDTDNARLIGAAPDLHDGAVELDRLMLVIESAVRNADPRNYKAVVAALNANRAAITKIYRRPASEITIEQLKGAIAEIDKSLKDPSFKGLPGHPYVDRLRLYIEREQLRERLAAIEV